MNERYKLYRQALCGRERVTVSLDLGTLNLGLVRDSVVNGVQDYKLFGEVFENVGHVTAVHIAVSSGE